VRSSYAFSHQEGFGRLITSGKMMRAGQGAKTGAADASFLRTVRRGPRSHPDATEGTFLEDVEEERPSGASNGHISGAPT